MVQEYTVIVGYGDSEKDEYTILALNKEHAEFIVMNHYHLENKYYQVVEAFKMYD